MRKIARVLFLAVLMAVGLVWAHGTYVQTEHIERYCAWDWGCWINPFAPNGQSRTEVTALYDYNGYLHYHQSVYYGGCCSDY